MISSFKGEYQFLSNFYPSSFAAYGMTYPTVEHFYQSAKTTDPNFCQMIRDAATPGRAKKLGRLAPLRPGWDRIKLQVMGVGLRYKFGDLNFRRKLLDTYPHELVEGNYWNDTFWGQCPVGTGFNHLGKLLMGLRREYRC